MAIPKVKITFDADLDGLRKGVNGASSEVEGFGGKVAKFGKMAGAAFAEVSVGCYVIAFVDDLPDDVSSAAAVVVVPSAVMWEVKLVGALLVLVKGCPESAIVGRCSEGVGFQLGVL
jgi:hypothetical protein